MRLSSLLLVLVCSLGLVPVVFAGASTTALGPYPKKIACDFYQTGAKKIVSCKNRAAANKFCAIAMQSRLSKATECSDNGRIVCTRPCSSITKAKPFSTCPYDPERRNGYTITPYNFCAK